MGFAASGWGRTETSNSPQDLRVISLYQYTLSECNVRNPSEFCAGQGEPGRGICFGDSGGPLAWIDPSTSEVKLIGVSSYIRTEQRDCSSNSRSYFARVPTEVNWINRVTQGCNQNTCRQGQCMTRDKLKPQARRIMERRT